MRTGRRRPAQTHGARTLGLAGAVLFGTLGGCAAGAPSYVARDGLMSLPETVVYQGGAGPLSYRAAAGGVVARERAHGRACQRGITLPFIGLFVYRHGAPAGPAALSAGWGDGTYAELTAQMLATQPKGATLTDLRADVSYRAILSVYREQCLELDAAVVLPPTPQLGS
jgi:hypothetical protein